MSYRIVYAEQANNDLKNIYEYIAFNLLSPETAKKLIFNIINNIKKLDTFPEMHPIFKNIYWKDRGLRFMKVNNHFVFYFVFQDKNTVLIASIMYEGQNIYEQLKDIKI